MSEPKQNPEDEVLVIKLFRVDPFCLDYSFRAESKYEAHEPEHMEQLIVLKDIIEKALKNAETAALQDLVMKKRQIRRAQAEYMSTAVKEEEVKH